MALAAGKQSAAPRPWDALGRSDGAISGECKGNAVYQVRVALDDLVAKGSCPSRKLPYGVWNTQAARLVDAQAPGLASRVRRLGLLPRSGSDWGERLADGLGRLALITDLYEGGNAEEMLARVRAGEAGYRAVDQLSQFHARVVGPCVVPASLRRRNSR